MKTFGFILSFYLLLLAIEPGISNLVHSGEADAMCCSGKSCEPLEDEQPATKPEKGGCDDTNTCNPFLTCSNCINFISDPVAVDFLPLDAPSPPHTVKQDKVPLSIAIDFWQPPKIA